jgi:uncharacterized protein (TIGR02466 family)
MEPKLHSLFPKPVYQIPNLHLDKLPETEQVLKNYCELHETKRSNTLNVNSTAETINTLNKDPKLNYLSKSIFDYSIEFMKTLDYDHHLIEECKFHKMWFNISNENDFLFPHNHGDCLLSGVYYVKAPQNCFLHFYDDPKQYKIQMQNPNLFTAEEIAFECLPGTLLIFKNDMLHGNGLQPAGEKIAISFNIGL